MPAALKMLEDLMKKCYKESGMVFINYGIVYKK